MDYSVIVASVERVKADNLSMALDVIVDGQVVISQERMLESIRPLNEILDHLSSLNS